MAPLAAPGNAAASRWGWHIQIGAYTDEGEAKGRLAAARARLSGLLAKAESYTEKTIKGSVEYVRARFAGFSDEADARKACDVLKKNDFTCIPVRN
jgi:D-alanyl-D-alanine carboxypeptidase